MKPASFHIAYPAVLALVSFLVHLPCRAQDSNIEYWSKSEQSQRMQYARVSVDFNFVFQSRAVSDSTFNPIWGCHIINKTQGMATVSDANGDFKISANVGDSISFSSIGYENLTIVFTESMYNYGYIIKLKPKAYELDEVIIQPFQIELPAISKYEIYTKPLPNQGGINIPLPEALAHPITALYNRYRKEGKQKRYYSSVKEGTADYMLIGEKFNGNMVSQLTGLKDDELVAFMSFCNFSNDFLMNYSLETIKRAIKGKYEEYKK